MRKRMKIMAGATAPIVALGGAVAVAEAPAVAAASPGDYTGNGVAIRSGPTLGSTIKGYGYIGQGLSANCYKAGDYVTRGSVTSNIWVNNTNSASGINGASSWLYVTYSPAIRAC